MVRLRGCTDVAAQSKEKEGRTSWSYPLLIVCYRIRCSAGIRTECGIRLAYPMRSKIVGYSPGRPSVSANSWVSSGSSFGGLRYAWARPVAVDVSKRRSNVRPSATHCYTVLSRVVSRIKWEAEAIFLRSVRFCDRSLSAPAITFSEMKRGRLGAPKTS